jgi:hypothetical protein
MAIPTLNGTLNGQPFELNGTIGVYHPLSLLFVFYNSNQDVISQLQVLHPGFTTEVTNTIDAILAGNTTAGGNTLPSRDTSNKVRDILTFALVSITPERLALTKTFTGWCALHPSPRPKLPARRLQRHQRRHLPNEVVSRYSW